MQCQINDIFESTLLILCNTPCNHDTCSTPPPNSKLSKTEPHNFEFIKHHRVFVRQNLDDCEIITVNISIMDGES
jgi:hypothetical protein